MSALGALIEPLYLSVPCPRCRIVAGQHCQNLHSSRLAGNEDGSQYYSDRKLLSNGRSHKEREDAYWAKRREDKRREAEERTLTCIFCGQVLPDADALAGHEDECGG